MIGSIRLKTSALIAMELDYSSHRNADPPPGSVVSRYGVRRYYSIDAPQGLRSDVNKYPPVQKQPSNHKEVARSKSAPLDVTAFDQRVPRSTKPSTSQLETFKFHQSPRNAPREPVDPFASRPPGQSLQRATSPARSYGSRSVLTEDYYNALSRQAHDLDREQGAISRSFDFPYADSVVGSIPTPLPTRDVRSIPTPLPLIDVGVMTEVYDNSPRTPIPAAHPYLVSKSTQVTADQYQYLVSKNHPVPSLNKVSGIKALQVNINII